MCRSEPRACTPETFDSDTTTDCRTPLDSSSTTACQVLRIVVSEMVAVAPCVRAMPTVVREDLESGALSMRALSHERLVEAPEAEMAVSVAPVMQDPVMDADAPFPITTPSMIRELQCTWQPDILTEVPDPSANTTIGRLELRKDESDAVNVDFESDLKSSAAGVS